MSVPAAPVEILTEIHINLPWLDGHDLDAVAATVWPYLYAAALRHAADSDRILNCTVDLACAHQVITELGRMADEATA